MNSPANISMAFKLPEGEIVFDREAGTISWPYTMRGLDAVGLASANVPKASLTLEEGCLVLTLFDGLTFQKIVRAVKASGTAAAVVSIESALSEFGFVPGSTWPDLDPVLKLPLPGGDVVTYNLATSTITWPIRSQGAVISLSADWFSGWLAAIGPAEEGRLCLKFNSPSGAGIVQIIGDTGTPGVVRNLDQILLYFGLLAPAF